MASLSAMCLPQAKSVVGFSSPKHNHVRKVRALASNPARKHALTLKRAAAPRQLALRARVCAAPRATMDTAEAFPTQPSSQGALVLQAMTRTVAHAVRSVASALVAVPGGARTTKLFASVGCRVVMVAGMSMTNTLPLITSAVASFIKLYLLLLFTRVLLTWFPNVNWMGQPWVTLRQVTDPYLNLFRNLIPPIMGQIDMTPIFGFLVLQFAAQVLGTDDII